MTAGSARVREGVRLKSEELVQTLRTAAKAELGDGAWVAGIADAYVFLTPAARAVPEEKRNALLRALTRSLQQRAEIAAVIDPRTVKRPCPPPADETMEALVCRSLRAGSGGDLYLVPRPGSFVGLTSISHGTNHGTPYLYDRAVPLLVRAPGRVAAGVVLDDPMATAAFVRTAAALLGVAPPPGALPAPTLLSPPPR